MATDLQAAQPVPGTVAGIDHELNLLRHRRDEIRRVLTSGACTPRRRQELEAFLSATLGRMERLLDRRTELAQ